MRKTLLLTLFLASTTLFAAPGTKLAPDTAQAASATGSVQVIIQWSETTGADTQSKIKQVGGSVIKEFHYISAGVYQIPASAIGTLDNDPAVSYITLDRQVRHKLAYSAAAINAPAVWKAGWTGKGIGVAVIDSGINTSADLGAGPNSSIVYSRDFSNFPEVGKPAPDQYGHGQHVAGIIASNGASSSCPACTQSYIGISPGAHLINLKVLNASGSGTDSAIMAAIEEAIDLKPRYNIRVINLSIGRPVFESYKLDPLCMAVEAAWKAGIVVVAAAGNDGRETGFGVEGYSTITVPGNDPYVVTVGAMKAENTFTRTDDLIASYSAKGPTAVDHAVKPDLVAPGNLVISLLAPDSALLAQYPANQVPLSTYTSGLSASDGAKLSPAYFTISGTSMATAVVSGAVADLLQAHPELSADQVKLLLMQTATKSFPTSSSVVDPVTSTTYTAYYDLFTIGAGYLDLQAALNQAAGAKLVGSAASPIAVHDRTVGTVELKFEPASAWAKQSSLANSVWGNSVLSGDVALWGGEAPWGNPSSSRGMPAGASAIWSPFSIWLLNAVTGGTAGQMSMWGSGTNQGQMSMWGLGANQSQMSMWGLGANQSQMSMWGLGANQSQMSMWGLGANQSQMSMWGLGANQSQMSMWGLGANQPQMSMWGLGANQSQITPWSLFTTDSEAISAAGEN